MRPYSSVLAGAACALVALVSPVLAYEIDPLTRQPLDNALTVRVRPQAQAVVPVPTPTP